MSSRSAAELEAVVSNRISRTFNKSETTVALLLDISEAYKMVWHAVLLYERKCLLNIMSVITGFNWFLMEYLTRISK